MISLTEAGIGTELLPPTKITLHRLYFD